jgi:methyl-accepting chemotaxis protein
MAKPKTGKRARTRRLPLSARLSILVLFAAILPLVAVVGINDLLARRTLEQQGRAALTTDAQSKASLVELYLHERVLDGQALATLPTAPAFLICAELPSLPADQQAQLTPLATTLGCQTQEATLYTPSNCRGLKVGVNRDPNYVVWTLYDARGSALLSSSSESADETSCPAPNAAAVSPDILQQVVPKASSWISPVYSDATKQNSFIDVYTSITLAPLTGNKVQTVAGFLRATLKLSYIDSLMQKEAGADGAGSYAFISDSSGIRFADSNPAELFTAVMPLSAATQQQISSTHRFGNTDQLHEDLLPAVANSLNTRQDPDSFQSAAVPGSSTLYQFVRVHINVANPVTNAPIPVGWSYFVLSPISTVTAVANNQLTTSLMIAAVIAVLAVLLGLITGRQVARPVHAAAGELEGAAAALKVLASRQENSAGEQQWVVDACKNGLESVRYLCDAMNQAARRIFDASNWFSDYWDRLNEEQARRTVQHLLELARYIDEGARRQQASNDRLGKAITVTDQVSDQLAAGATAATQSAERLEQVVSNLQRVVGGYRSSRSRPAAYGPVNVEPFESQALPSLEAVPGARGPQRLMDPQVAPAPYAPQSPWNGDHPSQTFDSGYGYNGVSNPNGPQNGYEVQPWADAGLPTPSSTRPYSE